jgi:hypothetical protein
MTPFNEREGRLRAMAETVPAYVDLDDAADVALALVVAGYRGAEIGDDLPEIMRLAKAMKTGRNSVTDVAATAAELNGAA